MTAINFSNFPDARGHFGVHGGRFVSETLMAALLDLEKLYARLKDDPQFRADFDKDLAFYVGRPSPLYHAERWSRELGGAQIYLKREDLNHTGAHKVNNTIGQAFGQNPYYCRNRRRSTWRCHRNYRCSFGHGVCGVYG